MPGSTVPFALPYPLAGDPVAVEKDIQRLAERIDVVIPQLLAQAAPAAMPNAAVVSGAPQQILNNTPTNLAFNNVIYDNAGYANLPLSNTTLNPSPGVLHIVFAHVTFAGNVTGVRRINIIDSGGNATNLRQERAMQVSAATPLLLGGALLFLPPADPALTFQVYQTSGTTLQVQSARFGAVSIG